MKKNNIIQTATQLFANQGFDGTTTLQIAKEAGVTEPLIYYHFEGKDDLFKHIINKAFQAYFHRLESLEIETSTHFEKIENLIKLHFDVLNEMPEEIYLAISTCPAKLKDAKHICTTNIGKMRKWQTTYLKKCIKDGIASGEFVEMPVSETIALIIALINGIIRQHSLRLEKLRGTKTAAVEFCRRSMVR